MANEPTRADGRAPAPVNDEAKQSMIRWLATCADVYRQELSPLIPEAFWMFLRTWTPDEVDFAFQTHLATGKYMPHPSDLLEIRDGGSAKELALRSWPKVQRTYGMDLVNRVLLLPDGAAALAITGMREDGTPESSVSDDRASFRRNPCFDFYESLYRRHHLNGLHRVPGPIAGKRYKSHVDGSFAPQRRELPAFWWTPELLRRHRAAIERFKPDEPIPESVPAPEDDRDGRGD